MTHTKLKISLCSDLHLEFGYQELEGGDILIIAGDVCEYRTLSKQFHSTKVLPYIPGKLNAYDFFYHECAKYKKVFYVLGNHEFYHHRFDKTYDLLKSMMPPNVTLLEKQAEEYEGVLFVGATTWTDCNKIDWASIWTLKQSMNDYRLIKFHDANDVYRKLMPEDTIQDHKLALEYFRTVLAENKEKPVVMITHHAPSSLSIHDKYKGAVNMNGGYMSDLSDIMLDNPNIRYWFHGHIHDPVDYEIGSTRVLANPRGYLGHEDNSGFRPDFTVEL